MDQKWNINSNVLYSLIENEAVLMSIEEGYYYALDPVGTSIWNILTKHPSTLKELATQLMEEYDVDKETCMKDVQDFIDDMASKKLIIPVEQENPPEK